MSDDIRPRPDVVIAEVGGMVDETGVTLAVYGDDLVPEVITAALGCSPTQAHRKGDRKREGSPPFSTGAWLLRVEGKAPQGPDELIRNLLTRFPSTPEFWRPIADQYRLQVRVGIHTGGWNRGFDITAETLASLSKLGAVLGFDLYFYGDENDQGEPTTGDRI